MSRAMTRRSRLPRGGSSDKGTAIVVPEEPVFENLQYPLEFDPPNQAEYPRLLLPRIVADGG